jgi:hypothetical protein
VSELWCGVRVAIPPGSFFNVSGSFFAASTVSFVVAFTVVGVGDRCSLPRRAGGFVGFFRGVSSFAEYLFGLGLLEQ